MNKQTYEEWMDGNEQDMKDLYEVLKDELGDKLVASFEAYKQQGYREYLAENITY